MKQETFKLTINLKNPAIYHNTDSLGYRTYETDVLTGYLKIGYYDKTLEADGDKYREPLFQITDLKNETYILASGGKVTYTCTVNPSVGCGLGTYCNVPSFYHYIGNNATSAFYEPTIQLNVKAVPNYIESKTSESTEEDDLYCVMAGSGIIDEDAEGNKKTTFFNGTLGGSLGCGCATYGHTSPTRSAFSTGAAKTEVTPGTKDPTDPEGKKLLNDPTVADIAAVFGTWTATYVKTETVEDPVE